MLKANLKRLFKSSKLIERRSVFDGRRVDFKLLLKRLYYTPQMIIHLITMYRFIKRGAEIELANLRSVRINGPYKNLKIEYGTVVGRCVISSHDKVVIGKCVVIGDGSKILTGSHSVESPRWDLITRPITIGDYVWIGEDVLLLPGVTIGKMAVIGAGSVVRDDVPEGSIQIGNPAVEIGKRKREHFHYVPLCRTFPFLLYFKD